MSPFIETNVDTASISYRVAEFLKKHPPFHAMEDEDLLELARRGRVKFFEPNEYILWQGEPYRFQVFVIQQGTVTLWNEADERADLHDVCGAGDMLGIEQLADPVSYRYSARSSSDVLLYAFPSDDFEALVLKYPHARRYVSAYGKVTAHQPSPEEGRHPQDIFLHDVVGRRKLPTCDASASIRDVARYLRTTGASAIAVLDSERRARGVLTASSFLEWLEKGGGDVEAPVAILMGDPPPAIASDALVTDAVLAMGELDAGVLAMTSDGTWGSQLHAIVTSRDLAQIFGDQPEAILRAIMRAPDTQALREINQRARAFALRYLTSASAFDWLARFTSLTDARVVRRIIAMSDPEELPACWCFCGSSGRGESLTGMEPQLLMIFADHEEARALSAYKRVLDSLAECGYLPRMEAPFEPSFYAASLAEWRQRYQNWVRDPVRTEMYRARPLFDLRPVHGRQTLWHEVEGTVTATVDREFLHILANDCLANLPPLTFFHDAVVDDSGEETAVFKLEDNALQPLVDVGRVFGIASKRVMGSSTLDRFAMARALLPEREAIFREASETLRVVLWQQGRIGISQGTNGSELPASSLSRYDRQVLKSGFRSILRLLEFTADPKWLGAL